VIEPNSTQLIRQRGAENTRSACRITNARRDTHTHTLRISTNHCFSTVTILMRTQHSITLYVYRLFCIWWLRSAWATQRDVRLSQYYYLIWRFFQIISINFSCLFVFGATGPPPMGQDLLIHEVSRSHTTTHHSSGRVISSSKRHLPDNTQHSQQTNIHSLGGIQTHNLRRRAVADLCLRPRGHWDRHNFLL